MVIAGMKRTRSVGLAVLGSIVALIMLRFAIAISVGSEIPGNPVGFTTIDALLLALLLVGGALLFALWGLGRRYRAIYRGVHRLFPADLVVITSVLPGTVAAARATIGANALVPNSIAALLLTRYECSWWTGGLRPRRVARIRSETPLSLRAGKLEHFGPVDALIIEARTGGSTIEVPVAVLSNPDDRFLPRPLTAGEITHMAKTVDFGRS